MSAVHDVSWWHRKLCLVTDQIIISGDLSEDRAVAREQVNHWERVGITHVLDTRSEWNDKDLLTEISPEIVYGWVGTDDFGFRQPDEWFEAGLEFASEALIEPDTVMLVHCHMGINRGPSMAFRILLDLGWDPIEALDAIRNARPIADVAYASDALTHFHRRNEVLPERRTEDLDRLEAWTRGYSTTGLRLRRSAPTVPISEGELDGDETD